MALPQLLDATTAHLCTGDIDTPLPESQAAVRDATSHDTPHEAASPSSARVSCSDLGQDAVIGMPSPASSSSSLLSRADTGLSGDTAASPVSCIWPAKLPAAYEPKLGAIPRDESKGAKSRKRPRWLQPRPLLGLFALMLAAGCVLFSMAILIVSNDRPIAKWTVQPTVYLAVAAAFANSAISFAHAQAVPIAWWYQASRSEGVTIRGLDRQWKASFFVSHALRSAWFTRSTSAATLLVALMIIDGPLLQRASSVIVAKQSQVVGLALQLSPELPIGFSGIVQPGTDGLVLTDDVVGACNDWMNKSPIPMSTTPLCKGICAGRVLGPGMAKDYCRTTTWPITSAIYTDRNFTWGQSNDTMGFGSTPLFSLYVTSSGGPLGTPFPGFASQAAVLYTGNLNVVNGSGTYNATTCYMIPAIIEYEVTFNDAGHVVLQPDSFNTGRVVSYANNTPAVPSPGIDWDDITQPLNDTLDYLTEVFQTMTGANASAGLYGTFDVMQFTPQAMKYIDERPGNDIRTFDPTADVFHSMNELMFRSAVRASTWGNITSLIDAGLTINQTTTANQTVTRNVFRSDFHWYAAATTIELIAVLMVLPLYWGFWRLEKHLALSPLSTAAAFGAPLLRAGSAHDCDDVVQKLGDVRVRYMSGCAGGEGDGDRGGDLERGEMNGRSAGFVACDKAP
jgi:hypothetical protein